MSTDASRERKADFMSAQPVRVDSRNRKTVDAGLEGHFVDITSGEFAGRRGSFERVQEYNKTDGYPETIFVRTRDAENELLAVPYHSVKHTNYKGGR